MTKTTLEVKERLINALKYNDYEAEEDFLIGVYNWLQEEIRCYHSLDDYGINELASNIDYIEDEIKNGNIQDSYTLVDAIFSGAWANGTLTFSSLQAEMEVTANYGLDEIQEIQNDYGLDNWEQVHIEFCKREFTDYFEANKYLIKEEHPELTEQELLIKTCHSILEKEEN